MCSRGSKLRTAVFLLWTACGDVHPPEASPPAIAPAVRAPLKASPVARPPRIACDELVCFEAAQTLGEASAVVLTRRPRHMREGPPLLPLQPKFFDELDATQLMAENVTLIVARSERADRYRATGIPVLTWDPVEWSTSFGHQELVAAQAQRLRVLAEALGSEAQERARSWAQYADAKVDFIWSRTRYRQLERAPRVAYLAHGIGAPDGGVTPCVYAFASLGGANVASRNLQRTEPAPALTKAELIAWNPEQILLGRSVSPVPFAADADLRGLIAVRHHALYKLPATDFAWDEGPESVLLMLWIAKLAQPALFRDLSLEDEVRAYYEQFYGVGLNADQLERMLDPQP